jgi:hypothetical protein
VIFIESRDHSVTKFLGPSNVAIPGSLSHNTHLKWWKRLGSAFLDALCLIPSWSKEMNISERITIDPQVCHGKPENSRSPLRRRNNPGVVEFRNDR